MLRPSAAPRWKTTTRRRFDEVSAITERTRKLGMAAVPAMARAPLWRKNRRLICMGDSCFFAFFLQLIAFPLCQCWDRAIPPLRREKVTRMGHGTFVVNSEARMFWFVLSQVSKARPGAPGICGGTNAG